MPDSGRTTGGNPRMNQLLQAPAGTGITVLGPSSLAATAAAGLAAAAWIPESSGSPMPSSYSSNFQIVLPRKCWLTQR